MGITESSMSILPIKNYKTDHKVLDNKQIDKQMNTFYCGENGIKATTSEFQE